MTRAERRKDKKKYEKDFVHFCWIMKLYFPDFIYWLSSLKAPRKFWIYETEVMLITVIMKNVCCIGSMQHINTDHFFEMTVRLLMQSVNGIIGLSGKETQHREKTFCPWTGKKAGVQNEKARMDIKRLWKKNMGEPPKEDAISRRTWAGMWTESSGKNAVNAVYREYKICIRIER